MGFLKITAFFFLIYNALAPHVLAAKLIGKPISAAPSGFPGQLPQMSMDLNAHIQALTPFAGAGPEMAAVLSQRLGAPEATQTQIIAGAILIRTLNQPQTMPIVEQLFHDVKINGRPVGAEVSGGLAKLERSFQDKPAQRVVFRTSLSALGDKLFPTTLSLDSIDEMKVTLDDFFAGAGSVRTSADPVLGVLAQSAPGHAKKINMTLQPHAPSSRANDPRKLPRPGSPAATRDAADPAAPFNERVNRELLQLLPRMSEGLDEQRSALARRIQPQRFLPLYGNYLMVRVPYVRIPLLPLIVAGGLMMSGPPAAALLGIIWSVGMLIPPAQIMAPKWFSTRVAVQGTHAGNRIFMDTDLNHADFSSTLAHELTHELRRLGLFKNDLTANGFAALRLIDLFGADGLPRYLASAEFEAFALGGDAMKKRLQEGTEENLDSYKSTFSLMFGRFAQIIFSITPEPPWTYYYGNFLAGLAHQLSLHTGRPEDSWSFLRLVSTGLSPEAALKVLQGREVSNGVSTRAAR